jgi:HAD superfamily hydrolase (TIGR01509 family)
MLQAALFDYDGTLADTDAIHHQCWNRVLAPYGVAIDADFYSRHCSGAVSRHIAEQIVGHFPAVGCAAMALAEQKDDAYRQHVASGPVPLMPHVAEFIDWLSARDVTLAVVTGAPRDAILPTLGQHGLLDRFAVLVTRERVSRGKPAPDGYRLALAELGLSDPGWSVSFEDTRDGTLAAKAAGLRSVAIPHTYTRSHDFSAADHVVASIRDARGCLEPLMHARPS